MMNIDDPNDIQYFKLVPSSLDYRSFSSKDATAITMTYHIPSLQQTQQQANHRANSRCKSKD